MPQASTPQKIGRPAIAVAALAGIALIAGLFYLNRPTSKATGNSATSAAKAYLVNLELSDVSMKATENFMQQQVIEVEGNLSNKGPRPLQAVDVYCLFYGIDGHEIYRERVSVISSKAAPLKPGETRRFRLPFDSVPNGWNQVLPRW